MSERNVLSGTTATLLSPFVDGWREIVVWLIVAVVLIVADLRFGIEAALTAAGYKLDGLATTDMDMLLEGVIWQDGEEERPADAQEEKPERRGGVA